MGRRRRRPLIPTVWMDWDDSIADLFAPNALVRDLRPPSRVRLYPGRDHTTLVARFAGENGARAVITMRLGKI
ncbi:MAG: hypothetical protein ACR2F8_02940 [Caulobacteraceae bacterium]